MFINPEHHTSYQLLSGVLLPGEGEAFKYSMSLPLEVPGMIIPQKGSHSLVCYLGWTLVSFEPRQHFVLPWLRLVAYPHPPCTMLYLPHVLNYCVQLETNPQASSPSTEVLPKGLTSMICVHFCLFYICDDVNTSLVDLQKSTLLVKCRKILDPKGSADYNLCPIE